MYSRRQVGLVYFVEPLHEEYSSTLYVCSAFNAAFAKLLWPLIYIPTMQFVRIFAKNKGKYFFKYSHAAKNAVFEETRHMSYKPQNQSNIVICAGALGVKKVTGSTKIDSGGRQLHAYVAPPAIKAGAPNFFLPGKVPDVITRQV